jgi:hypothetical protein
LPGFIRNLDLIDLILLVMLVLLLTGLTPESVMPEAKEWTGWMISFLVGKKMPQSIPQLTRRK